MTDPVESGANLLSRPARSWPAWATALVALVVVLAQSLMGVSVWAYSGSLDRFDASIVRLDASVTKNSDELNKVRLALEAGKVAEQRLKHCEKTNEDHEERIRALEGR